MSKFKQVIEKVTQEKDYTDEMKQWYDERTKRHIGNVSKYILTLPDMDEDERQRRATTHDESKFGDVEYDPYVWISWKYKTKADGVDFDSFNPPSDLDDRMAKASHHHITTNSHHPEYHSPTEVPVMNVSDWGKEQDVIDATSMPDGDIMEMCCDWAGMSDEVGGTPMEWAKKNVGSKWKFTSDQEALIYKTLEQIWK